MMDRTEDRVEAASRLMLAFAERTGLGEGPVNQRYLWTDAFSNLVSVLKIEDRFWMFLSSTTNTGHFEAFRSEPAFMQVPLD